MNTRRSHSTHPLFAGRYQVIIATSAVELNSDLKPD